MERLTIVTGHYGSGKTEFAVNLAVRDAQRGVAVTLADMDIVNPYFCPRERMEELAAHGVRVLISESGRYSDLPAISPEVLSLMETDMRGIMDIGGDPIGARVLSRFQPQLDKISFDLLFVLNANRPETSTAQRAITYLKGVETASKQHITGLVSNTHLCTQTAPEDIKKGLQLARQVSVLSGVPIAYTAVERSMLKKLDFALEGEILPMDIFMKKPWEV